MILVVTCRTLRKRFSIDNKTKIVKETLHLMVLLQNFLMIILSLNQVYLPVFLKHMDGKSHTR